MRCAASYFDFWEHDELPQVRCLLPLPHAVWNFGWHTLSTTLPSRAKMWCTTWCRDPMLARWDTQTATLTWEWLLGQDEIHYRLCWPMWLQSSVVSTLGVDSPLSAVSTLTPGFDSFWATRQVEIVHRTWVLVSLIRSEPSMVGLLLGCQNFCVWSVGSREFLWVTSRYPIWACMGNAQAVKYKGNP